MEYPDKINTLVTEYARGDWKKRALITGCTGGLGTACMNEIATHEDWRAIGVSRSRGLDLTRWDNTRIWLYQQNEFDLVVLAHGTHRIRYLDDLTREDWDYVVRNNLDATASLLAGIMATNRLNRGGLLVFCGSLQATHARAGRMAYAAAKAGLEGMMRATAAELAERGSRAVLLRMGQFEKPMADVKLSPEELQKMRARSYAPWQDVKHIAKLIFELYQQPGITGACIDVDSGQGCNVW